MNPTKSQTVDVEAIVRKVMNEMVADSSSSSKQTEKDSSSRKKKSNSKRKSKKLTKRKSEHDKKIFSQIESLVSELQELRHEFKSEDEDPNTKIPTQVKLNISETAKQGDVDYLSQSDFDFDDETTTSGLSLSGRTFTSTKSGNTTYTVGSDDFFRDVVSKLKGQRNSICIQGDYKPDMEENSEENPTIIHDFQSAFSPNDMRCLALVSHNGMKATMKEFVLQHKNILKKFRLTGTQSTMKMLSEVFQDEPDIVFGPSCQSGPLGGDAELVALMTSGDLGGILFFQDPMSSHPHQADIQCLVRQAIVHNTILANTPTTAMSLMQVLKLALVGQGKAELIPSFFFSLQSPTVGAYKKEQSEVIKRNSTVTFQ